jgi:trk system potassium uptake protein TrkA
VKVVIIGGGKTSYYLARSIIEKGYKVVVINKDEEFCKEMAQKLKALVINGDGSKRNVLEQAEFMRDDVVVVLTPRDHDNLIISQLVKRIFGVERVVSLVNDPENVEIFRNLGISTVVNLTMLINQTLETLMFAEEIEQHIPIEEEKLVFLKFEIPPGSPAKEKALKDIPLPSESIISAIIRGKDVIIPRGDTKIEVGDRVFVLCSPKVQTKVSEILLGVE